MKRVASFVRGDSVQVRPKLNAIVERLNQDTAPIGAAGANLGFLPHNILVLEVRVLNAADLTCTLPGQSLNGSAKTWTVTPPWTFTESSRNGISYVYSSINERTADGTEAQELTPLYMIGDFLAVGEYEQGLVWRDMNVDGRQWAAIP